MGWIGRMEEDEALVALRKERARLREAAQFGTTQVWQLERTLQIRFSGLESLPHGLGKEVIFRTQAENICDQARA